MTFLLVALGNNGSPQEVYFESMSLNENIFPLDKQPNKTPSFQMVHIDFLYGIVIDFSLLILLYLILLGVLRNKIEISDIFHYALFL